MKRKLMIKYYYWKWSNLCGFSFESYSKNEKLNRQPQKSASDQNKINQRALVCPQKRLWEKAESLCLCVWELQCCRRSNSNCCHWLQHIRSRLARRFFNGNDDPWSVGFEIQWLQKEERLISQWHCVTVHSLHRLNWWMSQFSTINWVSMRHSNTLTHIHAYTDDEQWNEFFCTENFPRITLS